MAYFQTLFSAATKLTGPINILPEIDSKPKATVWLVKGLLILPI